MEVTCNLYSEREDGTLVISGFRTLTDVAALEEGEEVFPERMLVGDFDAPERELEEDGPSAGDRYFRFRSDKLFDTQPDRFYILEVPRFLF